MKKVDYEIIPIPTSGNPTAFRNKAIRYSRAKYIMFAARGVDMDHDIGEHLMSQMEDYGFGMACCGYDIRDTSSPKAEIYYETPEFNRRVLDREDMLCRLFYQTHYQGFIWNKMFRTSILKRRHIRFDTDIPGSEELPFLVRYMCAAGDAVMLPDHLCHVNELPQADLDLEMEAYGRMKKKLWRHDDARWLCEESISLMELELDQEP